MRSRECRLRRAVSRDPVKLASIHPICCISIINALHAGNVIEHPSSKLCTRVFCSMIGEHVVLPFLAVVKVISIQMFGVEIAGKG